MSDIFISYRREDSEGWTGHLADRLQQAFGKNSVFYDYDSIEPSRDWKQAIEKGLRQCKLLIVVIGPKWVTATDVNGIRRLEDPADLVRLELSAAFQKHIPILPVLVGKAQLPKSVDLPGDLQDRYGEVAWSRLFQKVPRPASLAIPPSAPRDSGPDSPVTS